MPVSARNATPPTNTEVLMDSPERVLTALRGEQPDRVPLMEIIVDPKVVQALHPGCDRFDPDDAACVRHPRPGAGLRLIASRGSGGGHLPIPVHHPETMSLDMGRARDERRIAR